MNSLTENRYKKLSEIYKNFDFGYDVALLSEQDWIKESEDKYVKKVFIEFIESSSSLPHMNFLVVEFVPGQETVASIFYNLDRAMSKNRI